MVMAGLFYRLFMVINPLAILRIFSFHYAHLHFAEIFDQLLLSSEEKILCGWA